MTIFCYILLWAKSGIWILTVVLKQNCEIGGDVDEDVNVVESVQSKMLAERRSSDPSGAARFFLPIMLW